MLILGVNLGLHDGAAALFDDYRLLGAIQLERLSRRKNDGDGYVRDCVDCLLDMAGVSASDVDAVAFSRGFLKTGHIRFGLRRDLNWRLRRALGKDTYKEIASELQRRGTSDPEAVVDTDGLRAFYGFRPDVKVTFTNHHFSHALSALFYSRGENTLLYTADGAGDNVHYSIGHARGGHIENFYGDDRWLFEARDINSLGLAYGYVTQALGFRMNRHEGKITGLAAFGEPELLEDFEGRFHLDDRNVVMSDFASFRDMRAFLEERVAAVSRENAAASIQRLLENLVSRSVTAHLDRTGADSLALAGGVFANVALNRVVGELPGVENIFIFPGMGDEGLAVGNVLQFLLERDGPDTWNAARHALDDVYLGPAFGVGEIAAAADAVGAKKVGGDPAGEAARRLQHGEVGAIYHGRMEFGPRALGARSILGAPGDAAINDELNKRLERTEFMPFAPVVLEEHAREVFDLDDVNSYAARFMTITCDVKPEWRERVAAVVHVDGSARPQVIARDANPLYYDIVSSYHAATGVPVLINTSFNAHEEPIVCTPAQAMTALADRRVDFLVTEGGVFEIPEAAG
ncbi:MAG: hypothetical protein JJ899_02735 [Alphaproteobacteria bacterium]|nr:hypothetical protein [Alphaproteobacteria bacterium]